MNCGEGEKQENQEVHAKVQKPNKKIAHRRIFCSREFIALPVHEEMHTRPYG